MTATVCPINPPGHDWDNGLTCRWCPATRTPAEAIVSGLASRRGGTVEAARALLDAHTDQVLAEDGQAYPGELAMYRQLVRTLRVAARNAEWDTVQQALTNHAAADGAARNNAKAEKGGTS